MDKRELKDRTKKFALRCIKLADSLPNSTLGRIVRNQLMRCSTSVAANYRAACRARSKKEFISKLSVVEEEADECMFWFEIIIEAGLVREELMIDLSKEAEEILSIVIVSKKTARKNLNRKS